MTTPVPNASESGRLRLGFFTSPAVKVTLFHASAENNDPTCATPTATQTPTSPVNPICGKAASAPVLRQKLVKFAATAVALRPITIPTSTRPSSADVFA